MQVHTRAVQSFNEHPFVVNFNKVYMFHCCTVIPSNERGKTQSYGNAVLTIAAPSLQKTTNVRAFYHIYHLSLCRFNEEISNFSRPEIFSFFPSSNTRANWHFFFFCCVCRSPNAVALCDVSFFKWMPILRSTFAWQQTAKKRQLGDAEDDSRNGIPHGMRHTEGTTRCPLCVEIVSTAITMFIVKILSSFFAFIGQLNDGVCVCVQ